MILLDVGVVMCMLLMMGILLLEVVHHWHTPTPWTSIDAAMLPWLVALIEHSVEILSGGVGIGRSRRRGGVGTESGPNVIGRGAVPDYLVSWVM